MELMEHQKEAVAQLENGNILWGGVGSGKTMTAIAYYMEKESDKDLYVITTARKRDDLDWEKEAVRFGISDVRELSCAGKLTVDSWNNAHKYTNVKGAFFIFDEQRVVGHGTWVKAFLKIAKNNNWILLSATPGDTWMDYAPVFIANGFYSHITQFKAEHVIYAPYVKFPKIIRYVDVKRLEKLKNQILVEMPYMKHTKRHMNYMPTSYDTDKWNKAVRERWNPFEDRPILDVAELYRVMRRVVNGDPSKLEALRDLMRIHNRLIVFYNFNYELDILRTLASEITVAEWNGHKKDPIPDSERWLYLVQYSAGSEGWNCTETNALVIYSQTYSYKAFTQALGRIDRLNTLYFDLYYYILWSGAPIDVAIKKSLDRKENFNENGAKLG